MKIEAVHPYAPFLPKGTTKLIIGTIPPQRFCERRINAKDVDFFYGSWDNNFWRIISEIHSLNLHFENTVGAVEQRKSFLSSRQLGMMDIIERCIREGVSSLDSDLSEIKYQPLCEVLVSNPQIDTLIYTSDFVKKQINSYLKSWHSISKENKRIQVLKINGKNYKVVVLYSPSPTALRGMGENGMNKRLQQYTEVFG